MSRSLALAKLQRGDPGFLGGLAKLAGKVAPSLLKSIPGVGTVIGLASAGKAVYDATRPAQPVMKVAPPMMFPAPTKTPIPASMPPAQRMQMETLQAGVASGLTGLVGKGLSKLTGGKLIGAGGGTAIAKKVGGAVGGLAAYELGSRAIGAAFGGGGGEMIPPGYHYNKALRRYEVAESQGRDVKDPRDEPRVSNAIVRNRSMNPLNPRALLRSFARVKGAQKWARKLVRFEKKATVARRKR